MFSRFVQEMRQFVCLPKYSAGNGLKPFPIFPNEFICISKYVYQYKSMKATSVRILTYCLGALLDYFSVSLILIVILLLSELIHHKTHKFSWNIRIKKI